MKRGSIALARSICYEVAGPTDEDDDMTGSGYGSVDIAEILSSEVENLRAAICQTLDANSHLADGEVCTLLPLKVALRKSGAPWDGDELHNVQAHRLPERQSGGAAGSATLTEREEYMQLTEGTNDQLMAMAAMRYCLGRRSYIVGACHEWLREVWPQLTTNSQNVILRDIVEALRDDLAGDQLDMVGWTHTARWMWESMAADQRTWVQGAVGWRGIADVEAWLTVMPNTNSA